MSVRPAGRRDDAPGAHGLFVTGTDTGVGKTVACVALLQALVAHGWRAIGMKPVATGFDGHAEPDDVAAHAAVANVPAPLDLRNPYRFAAPVAPHLAASEAGATLDLAVIGAAYAGLATLADAIVVEGAGGPLVPLDARHDMLDIAVALQLPVLLVVGIRLGCQSHARLAEMAIRARGLRLAGWVAARIDPAMPRADENVASLATAFGRPSVDFNGVGQGSVSPSALAELGFRRQ